MHRRLPGASRRLVMQVALTILFEVTESRSIAGCTNAIGAWW